MTIESLLKHTRHRLLAALLFGLLVGVSNLYFAWQGGGNVNLVDQQQNDTNWTLSRIDDAMKHYRLTHPHPPATLLELDRAEHFRAAWEVNKPVIDAWGRPLQYRVSKNAYVVFSFGRDGKPDGTGSDMDLMTGMRWPRSLSFIDFLRHDRYSVVVWPIVIMGWIAGVIAWKCLDAYAAGALSMKRVIRRLLGASVLMWFLSLILAALGTFDGFG